jgi:hypothetical protein
MSPRLRAFIGAVFAIGYIVLSLWHPGWRAVLRIVLLLLRLAGRL